MESAYAGVNIKQNIRGYTVIADQISKQFRSSKSKFLLSLYRLEKLQTASLYYVRTYGWLGGPENGNFPLLYVVKMSLRR